MICGVNKILFVLKKRSNYGVSYGLKVSCSLVAKSLWSYTDSKIVEVIDGNFINAEVHRYKPDLVILEAIWCPPYKLEELLKLHKNIKWNVRLHSKISFLAQEKLALQWLAVYDEFSRKYPNFSISANNTDIISEMNAALDYNLQYTPNCYPVEDHGRTKLPPAGDILDIGCFGALRILKNTLFQAICAINVANQMKKKLRFHVNNSAIYEREGNPILNNLINIFANTHHELVIHDWDKHEDFLKIVRQMDVGMQVSFTESFNLTAADFVSHGIPLIGSKEIKFLSNSYQVPTTDFRETCDKLMFAINHKHQGTQKVNENLLRDHTKKAIKDWLRFLNK